uniref:Integrase, catalytic region, zinc finger, CCHC-type, peptidase aspartic, catalytic n=1 Tax=Tanacetum cinerariifolium TaxID=118510 RepID=A0A6L2LK97_TANCI|nr:integrase, catalytic region, zinc finger, CCHC-type, peptidase aspartic, catalytic [Tanacetum cinerariifolium]
MANLLKDIQCVGSDTRPPMLDRTDFASWKQRIRLYCSGKENGVNILKSIDEGPFQMGTVREPLAEGTEGAPHLGPECPRIYTLINHYTDAKDMWDNVKMLLEGSKLTKEDQESQLYDDFEHFRQHKGETIHDYYVRFTKLINDMRNIKMTMSKMQLNLKFANNMLPKWGRFVTAVKLNRGLRNSNYDQLYAYLKQHETHDNENKMMLDQFSQHTVDPLALMSNVSHQHHYSQSSSTLPSTYVPPHLADNGHQLHQIQRTKLQFKMAELWFRMFRVDRIEVMGQIHRVEVQLGHIARNCTQTKRPQNFNYYKDKMLLMQAQENGVALDEEQLLFLAGGQDTAIDEDALTEQTMFMANLSSVDPLNDEAGPSYDSDILFEVQDHDHYQDTVCAHHEEHAIHDNVQHNHVVDSHAHYTSDSTMILYDQYVKDNAVPVVHNNVSYVPNDAYMMIYNDMYEPHAQSVSKTSPNIVVENSLTAKLATYKEQVKLYERRARFELTEREQKINEQLRLVISDRNFKEETLKKELHSIKLQLASAINHNKLIVEVTSIKKDFKQKENKHLEDFLDMKSLKEKVEDRLFKQDQSLQIIHMLCRPKPYYNELNKVAIGYKNPLCLTHAKQVQPALYNGHEIIKDNHVPTIVHNTEDTLEIAEITRRKTNDKTKDPECKALTKEIKEMKDVFEELEAEVAQNVVDRKLDEIEPKNLLIANDNLIAECLTKEVFSVATNFELNVARFTEMHVANTIVETRCLELKDELSNLRDKSHNDNHDDVSKEHVKPKVLAPGKYAIDVEPIVPRLRNNREAHLDYLRHLKESVETIRDIVEEAKVVRPLDSLIVYVCRYTKHSQELLEYAIGTCPQDSHQRDKKHAPAPLIRKKQVTFAEHCDKSNNNIHKHVSKLNTQKTNVPVPPSTGVNRCIDASGSKPRSNTKKKRISSAKGVNKMQVKEQPRTNKSHLRTSNHVNSSSRPKRTLINSNSDSVFQTCNKCLIFANHDMCVVDYLQSVVAPSSIHNNSNVVRKLNHVWKSKQVRQVIQIVLWYLDSGCSKHITGDHSRFMNFVKKFIGTVRFENDHFGAIMGYGDYVIGDSVIFRVYYVEGLGHNLFFVRQFCDSDLEVAFKKHSCYVRDTNGVVLIKGSRWSNLYCISGEDMMKSSPIYLLSKASKNKSWLWHQRLNHLNIGTINDLARKDLVRGLPRLKFEKIISALRVN